MLDCDRLKVKFLFFEKLGLAQAEGWKSPGSLLTRAGDFWLSWVADPEEFGAAWSGSETSLAEESLEEDVAKVSGEASSFLDLWAG